MIDLKNKLVVITGATSGLGACLAEDIIKKGNRVVSISRNEPEHLNSEITYLNCDITDKEKVFSVIKDIKNSFGEIDIFINNAGLWMPHVPVEEETKETVQKMIDVNLFGTMYCTQAVLPIFKGKGFGVFVNIISTSALAGRPLSSGYAASKFAQDGFTKSVRVENKDSNIKIINIYPGGMKTHLFDAKKPEDYDSYMDPSEVAGKIVHFISEEEGEEIIIRRN